tara:strand:- start:1236 stop:1394 length:159 start_codon:yes stop_codon:yes gene_type:complete
MADKRKSDKLRYNLTEHFKKNSETHNRVMRREMIKGSDPEEAHKKAIKLSKT